MSINTIKEFKIEQTQEILEHRYNSVESEIDHDSIEDVKKTAVTVLPSSSQKLFEYNTNALQNPLESIESNQRLPFASSNVPQQYMFNQINFNTNNVHQAFVNAQGTTQQINLISQPSQIWSPTVQNQQFIVQNLPTINSTNQLVLGTSHGKMIPLKIIDPVTALPSPMKNQTFICIANPKPPQINVTPTIQKSTQHMGGNRKIVRTVVVPKVAPIAPKGGVVTNKKDTTKSGATEYKNPFVYPMIVDQSRPSTPVPRTRTKYSRWYCILCNRIFKGKEELITHYEEHRREQLASGASKQTTGKLHTQYHFQCRECTQDFFSYISYCKHNDQQHNKNQIKCPDCSKTCKNKMFLCLHLNDIHLRDIKFKCTECTCECDSRADLVKHLDCHDSWKHFCDQCDQVLTSATMYQEHKRTHNGENLFKCLWCDSSFVYSDLLMDHMSTSHASDALELKCTHCNQIFGKQKSLILHMQCHSSEGNLCDICGKPFRSKNLLQMHISNVHNKVGNFPCTICDKNFSKVGCLRVHMRSHTGEKPYECNLCNKTFTQRTSLVIHRRRHTDERPFKCPRCMKGFVFKSILNSHLKTNCAARKKKVKNDKK